MKFVIRMIVCFLFILNFSTTILSAAMDDKTSADSDMTMYDIVYERNRAKQEYQQYIKDKSAKQDMPVVAPVEHGTRIAEDVSGRRGFVTGIVLLVIALMLTVYLYYMSKNKKNKS